VTHDPNSFKKVAALTGLTVLIGGAEISNADAATFSDPTQTFSYTIGTQYDYESSTLSPDGTLSFAGFNAALGTLTQVEVQLNSNFNFNAHSVSASVTLAGKSIGSSNPTDAGCCNAVNAPFNEDVFFTTSLSPFITSSISADLAFGVSDGFGTWSGSGSPAGITVTYTYTPVSSTPLPATLPLFAGGLAGLGFTTWRGRRKQTAKK
jgi:hypothetical protein